MKTMKTLISILIVTLISVPVAAFLAYHAVLWEIDRTVQPTSSQELEL